MYHNILPYTHARKIISEMTKLTFGRHIQCRIASHKVSQRTRTNYISRYRETHSDAKINVLTTVVKNNTVQAVIGSIIYGYHSHHDEDNKRV